MSDITKENFVWKMKNKEYSLDQMDASFKLVALIHSIKLTGKSHKQFEHFREKSERTKKTLREKLESITKKIKEYEQEEQQLKQKIEAYQKKSSDFYEKTDYFQQLADVLEESLLEDHSLQVPTEIDDLWSFKRMYENGIIKENAA